MTNAALAAFDTALSFEGGICVPETVSQRYIRQAKENLERSGEERAAKALQPRKQGHTKFTTEYAIRWGRAQGWTLVDRERYDYRTKRHHDLEGATDVIFDDGHGRVGIQGAGKGEKASHYAKFEQWGGAEKARRRGLKVIYLEFTRGDYEPLLQESWTQ